MYLVEFQRNRWIEQRKLQNNGKQKTFEGENTEKYRRDTKLMCLFSCFGFVLSMVKRKKSIWHVIRTRQQIGKAYLCISTLFNSFYVCGLDGLYISGGFLFYFSSEERSIIFFSYSKILVNIFWSMDRNRPAYTTHSIWLSIYVTFLLVALHNMVGHKMELNVKENE